MEEDGDKTLSEPIHINTFGIPNDKQLLIAYPVYKTSIETKKLLSEQNRTIFAENFIENNKRGTLSDLCVRALAREYGPKYVLSLISDDPLKYRIHFDSLDIELPLEECVSITDEKYWRRVVLEKSPDKSLEFKEEWNWKNRGVSMKFVELVEDCPAEYWPEEEMQELALKIRDFVTDMHITRLQSLQEHSFEKYYKETSSSDETDFGTSSDVEDNISEDTPTEEEPDDIFGNEDERTEEEIELEREEMFLRKDERQLARQKRRENLVILKEQQRIRREKRAAYRLKREAILNPVQTKKKKQVKIKNVFDIEISEDEEELDRNVVDRRNLEKLVKKMKTYKYPAEHCHHIDLSFIRYFDFLEEFTLEFHGPKTNFEYHERHFRFSYQDVENLAFGMSFLKFLKIFRLRRSGMDARKLYTLSQSIKNLESIETIDFGYTQLEDNCSMGVLNIFQNTNTIKNIEFEGNMLGVEVMKSLARGIMEFEGDLDYLGLASNPLGDDGLHFLVGALLEKQTVKHLNLTAIQVSDEGIVCCLANELLVEHKELIQMDLSAIPMSTSAAVTLVIGLDANKKIISMDVRGCDMPIDIENDIAVLLTRNQYIVENPYIGDETKTAEEIEEFVSRIKHPILLDALTAVEKRKKCLKERPPDPYRYSIVPEIEEAEERVSGSSLYKLIQSEEKIESDKEDEPKKEDEESEDDSICTLLSPVDTSPFKYDTSTFTEEQFLSHMQVPGPGDRFYYFKHMKSRMFHTGDRD